MSFVQVGGPALQPLEHAIVSYPVHPKHPAGIPQHHVLELPHLLNSARLLRWLVGCAAAKIRGVSAPHKLLFFVGEDCTFRVHDANTRRVPLLVKQSL